MKVGRKSLLFGVHQFLWHPITVLAAWWYLYGRPSWKEIVCIIIHDWGYWFASNMDGPEGEYHPELAAKLAGKWLGPEYLDLCLYHSRHYARNVGVEPSKLCWADKLSIKYEPWWLYLPRAWASGELKEYRQVAADFIPLSASNKVWYTWVQDRLLKLGIEKKGNAVPYVNPDRRSS
ncbi:MAG: hypothetical protein WA125_16685 [Desulfosporosinus sp.]